MLTDRRSRSPDGTCLLTTSADGSSRTFVVPTTLLGPQEEPLRLSPYTIHPSPEPIYALTPYPFFSLQDPQTTLILTSPRDLPIRLTNILSPSPVSTATYPLINLTTESYLTPSSLLFHPNGTNFYAGTDCLITLFDVSRSGEGPVTRLPTIPSKRHKLKGGGVGMRGIVSALSLQPSIAGDGAQNDSGALLAAGAWTRQLALYDAEGMGGTVSTWSVDSAADKEAEIGGAGVSQVLWSPCGRYLFVVERNSRGVLVYDVRVTGRLVGWLAGREAETNQRLSVQVVDTGDRGSEIWAGGTDGMVRVWEWKGLGIDGDAGGIKAEWEWMAHGSSVTSVTVHPSATVVASSSGCRKSLDIPEDDSDDTDSSDSEGGRRPDDRSTRGSTRRSPSSGKQPDNSIKIWRL
jgi:WD40 repeat protein